MRILVTGASGFLGRHVCDAVVRLRPDVELTALSRRGPPSSRPGDVISVDVCDAERTADGLRGSTFDACIHLAAAAPPTSPSALYQTNVVGTGNLLAALNTGGAPCRLVLVSSGAVYGAAGGSGDAEESTPLEPLTSYGQSCVGREMAGRLLSAGRAFELCIVRPFNLVGPGQQDTMLVPTVARQIARIEADQQPPKLIVGRLDTSRDYLDVRDAAFAIGLIALHAGSLPSVINLGSGTPSSGADVLDLMLSLSHVRPEVCSSADTSRSSDVLRLVNRSALARTCIPWSPKYTLIDSLSETLADWRVRAGSGSA